MTSVLLMACCLASPAQSDSAEVHQAMTGFLTALAALDTARMAGYFAPGITAFVPTAQADRVNGKQDLERIFAAFAERAGSAPPRATVAEGLTIEASGDLAVVSFQVREGTTVRRRTFVWRRIGTHWLISHFHASDLSRPAG
jgi:ketosteroid isomerase-like protein